MSGYRLSAKASADLKAIYLYGEEQFGRVQAVTYARGMEAKLTLLAGRPGIGRARPEVDPLTRSFPHESHIIYYETHQDGTFVLRILHGTQDPARHHARLIGCGFRRLTGGHHQSLRTHRTSPLRVLKRMFWWPPLKLCSHALLVSFSVDDQ